MDMHWYISNDNPNCDMVYMNRDFTYYGYRVEPLYSTVEDYDLRKVFEGSVDELKEKRFTK